MFFVSPIILGMCGFPPVRPGREVLTSPLGLEAKSLKNGMTHYWISRAHEKQTKTKQTKKAVMNFSKILFIFGHFFSLQHNIGPTLSCDMLQKTINSTCGTCQ